MATSRIFIKGLPPNITEAEARKHFSAKDREVTDIKLIPQRRIGYVGFKTPEDASKAVKYFDKSYIRLSKISVEAARPISDSVTRRKEPTVSTEPPVNVNPSQKDAQTKKRKRGEDLDPSDPKLLEYLNVMKSGREGLIEQPHLPTEGDVSESMAKNIVPEDESDDEYEQIPARKDKQRRLDSPPPKQQQQQQTQHRHGQEQQQAQTVDPAEKRGETDEQDSTMLDVAPATDSASDAVNTTAEVQVPAATDDDWLRSRTNRLVDLVEPEDLPMTATRDSNSVAASTIAPPDTGAQVPQSAEEPAVTETAEGPQIDDRVDLPPEEVIRRTSRLFIRNLSYTTTEDDLRSELEKFGPVEEVHLPVAASGSSKGFALALFADSSSAVKAFQSMDGVTFQGRLLHIIPGHAKKDSALDEYAISKLPLKQQNVMRKRAEAASSTFNWNSLYMNQDAVNSSVATRLGVSKSELLDPTSADAAIRQAIAETTVIGETKAYFAANGVDLDAFKGNKRGDKAILVKNFPYGTTMEELRKLFEESGPVLRVLMPPSGTIAIIDFAQANHAKAAFGKLAYRRIKDSVLFLEKAPKDIFKSEPSSVQAAQPSDRPPVAGVQKLNVTDLLSRDDGAEEGQVETTSLFIRNLNFATTTSRLTEVFGSLDGFVSARVKTKMDPKKPGQTLSMGFGFAEFRTKAQAQEALKAMDGFVLDEHALAVKASHRGLDAAEERKREDKAKKAAGQRTKLIIKNLPFQATKKDVRALFGTYGQLRSVRVPKKADYTARGFGFADFVTPREAENALNALRDTHLLGRKLVLDFAEAEAVDAEEEIEKMQRKVGRQANKVALQQLTGGGRKRVNIGNNEDDGAEG